jgi:hypothetical protein
MIKITTRKKKTTERSLLLGLVIQQQGAAREGASKLTQKVENELKSLV